MKFLVVDDEAHIRQMMRLTLESSGYDVDEAVSGEDALGRFGGGGTYDAVLLDQKMPGIDGLETLKLIRQRVSDACVIMVTAFGSIELAVDAMKLGATDFLSKPMTPETLRGSVAAALASRSDRHPRAAAASDQPPIQVLTMNGFQIVKASAPGGSREDHLYKVKHFPAGTESTVTVSIDREAVARVARLTRRDLKPGGAFWSQQADRFLSSFLWSEGHIPETGRLTLLDASRDAVDLAASWDAD
jgi:FixJ family two-component response regulator